MTNRMYALGFASALACTVAVTGTAHAASKPSAAADSMVIEGGHEGTVFRSLTVEGEDRVHLEIDRPGLRLDLDPSSAPGLDLGGTLDVLDRTRPDLVAPLFGTVAATTSPVTGRPWLDEMRTGPVARFRPQVSDVATWSLSVNDSRGHTVASFEGKGRPPAEIEWDGRGVEGSLALPGFTYSYVLEARDRAGNRRHFLGDGFDVPAYRTATPQGPVMVMPGSAVAAGAPDGTSPAVLEAASWIDQLPIGTPVEIAVVARSHERAAAVARSVHRQLEAYLVGDAARVRERFVVEPEAPAGDAVVIRTLAEKQTP